MKKRLIDLGSQIAILDIASYGHGTVRSFTPAQRAQIARTVARAPEVMVKVSGGARTLGGVGAHLAYIGRDDFEIETDTGERIHERASQKALLEDWDLDLETHWHQSERAINEPRRSPKLVHNIIFSMPPGTDPRKVLEAVRSFAVNEWALKHRHAMVPGKLRSCDDLRLPATEGNIAWGQFEARCSIQLSYGRVGGKFSGFAPRTEAAVTDDRAGAFAPPRRNQSSWRRSNETRIKYLRRHGAPLAAGGPKVVRSLVVKHHSYR